MPNDQEDLRTACLEIAKSTMWERKPIDADRIKNLADRLYEIAAGRATDLDELGANLPLVTRAVQYLGDTHAIPPCGEDTHWFSNALDVLLELSCPNAGLKDGRAFLGDILTGIGTFLAEKPSP